LGGVPSPAPAAVTRIALPVLGAGPLLWLSASCFRMRDSGCFFTISVRVERLPLDLLPALRLGMRTALVAGDKGSLVATADQLKDGSSRPGVMLTELTQIADVGG
jgi:hypothetical protein